jgi:hypothetical protein
MQDVVESRARWMFLSCSAAGVNVLLPGTWLLIVFQKVAVIVAAFDSIQNAMALLKPWIWGVKFNDRRT